MIYQVPSGHLGHFGHQFTENPFVRNYIENLSETAALKCPDKYLLSSGKIEFSLGLFLLPVSALKCPDVVSA